VRRATPPRMPISNPMKRRNKAPERLPLRQAPQCGARTRRGTVCKSKAANGKGRCRLHGGALRSGAPSGPRNGNYRHGRHTKEAIAERQFMRALIRQSRELVQRIAL
jgi:glucans biosynthesis protein